MLFFFIYTVHLVLYCIFICIQILTVYIIIVFIWKFKEKWFVHFFAHLKTWIWTWIEKIKFSLIFWLVKMIQINCFFDPPTDALVNWHTGKIQQDHWTKNNIIFQRILVLERCLFIFKYMKYVKQAPLANQSQFDTDLYGKICEWHLRIRKSSQWHHQLRTAPLSRIWIMIKYDYIQKAIKERSLYCIITGAVNHFKFSASLSAIWVLHFRQNNSYKQWQSTLPKIKMAFYI